MSFLGIYIILKLSFGVSTRGFLDFLLGGIGDGCEAIAPKRPSKSATADREAGDNSLWTAALAR